MFFVLIFQTSKLCQCYFSRFFQLWLRVRWRLDILTCIGCFVYTTPSNGKEMDNVKYLGPFRTAKGNYGSFWISWDNLGSIGTNWGHLRLFMTIWEHLLPFGTLSNHFQLCQTQVDHLELFIFHHLSSIIYYPLSILIILRATIAIIKLNYTYP